MIAEKVQAVAERHARMPSREAFTDAVESDDDDDGPEIGWARVLTGAESCGFCAMLASRGPVYKSKKTASDAGGVDGKSYHDNCDCEVVLVREDQDWVGREEYEALEQLWASSTAGTNGKSALKAFTAALNQEIIDGTAGRFIADPDRDIDAPSADVKPEVERADDYGPTRQGEAVPFAPSDAPKLAEAVRNHILHGDDDDIESGGHLFGVGRAKKTEFPERWSAERIEQAVDEVLAQPDRIESQAGTYLFHREIDRVNVRVVVKSRGAKARIVSAYPINGDGVMKNRERGGKSRLPLRAVPLQKWPAVGSQP
ncbi:EndoU domain-containing protein [Rhodococcus erythropolis]|nr:EndoU domain-containing protein [Rhodococcus erythropolis]